MAQEYKIESQRQVMNLNPSGTGFSHDWEISYSVTSGPARGVHATVTVPASDHNAEYVDSAIREQMANLHNVASLGSSS